MDFSNERWKIIDENNSGSILIQSETEDIAFVVIGLRRDNNSKGYPTSIANAKLIAAAPELLETLKLVLKSHTGNGEITGKEVMNSVNAAINKATK